MISSPCPLRIALDGTALYGQYGGVAYALWNLLVALAAQDDANSYTVFVSADGPSRHQIESLGARFRLEYLPFRGGEKLRRIRWQQGQFPRVLSAFDVLHSPTYVAPLRSPIPVVLTVYDLIALDTPQFATPMNRVHYGALLPASIRRARRIIVPSEKVRAAILRRQLCDEESLRVIAPGVEAAFFATATPQQKNALRARYNLPDKFLLFVGNYEPKKNLETLLGAARMVPDAPPPIVVGGAHRWTREAQMLKQRGVRELGYVPRHELPTLLALCEAFIFPSLAEGFGLPVLEALAAGAPVITSTQVPIARIENAALLCNPHDARSLAHQLNRLLGDADLRHRLKKVGPQFAREYSWKRAAQDTLRVYREAAPWATISDTAVS